ncbi:hypothetical protein BDQ17DRAFT_1541980 [Cyathus striatus]|nr:hypothetical protein BDQ17DRAFT_1541980 [Cyathus striatus]
MLSGVFSNPSLQLLLLVPFVHGFSWSRPTGKYASSVSSSVITHQTDATTERMDESLRTDRAFLEDVQLPVARDEPFGSYFRRPDCFQKAAKTIRKRCSDLHLDEQEWIHAAISMTLCEIATAKHHTLPLECTIFTTGYDYILDSQMQGQCVDALSRSAQFWSSYSGYLREIPQLCFAFRKSEDIDMARDIYRNSTIEQINFFHSLENQEKRIEGNLHRWENQLTEFRLVAAELQTASLSIDETINKWDLYARENIASMQLQVHEMVSEGSRRLYEAGILVSERVDMSLSAVFLHHEAELQRHVNALEARLFQVTDFIFVEMNQRNEGLLRITTEVVSRWENINLELLEFQQCLEEVSHSIYRAAAALDKSSHESEIALQQQLKATAETSSLIETIEQLRKVADEQMSKINESAASIHQHLVAHKLVSYQWLKELFLGGLNMVAQVEPATLDYILHLPALRLVLTLCFGVASILRTVISGVLSLVVILFVISRRRIVASFLPTTVNVMGSDGACNILKRESTKTLVSNSCPLNISSERELAYSYSRCTRRRVFRIPQRLCKVSSDL